MNVYIPRPFEKTKVLSSRRNGQYATNLMFKMYTDNNEVAKFFEWIFTVENFWNDTFRKKRIRGGGRNQWKETSFLEGDTRNLLFLVKIIYVCLSACRGEISLI